MSPRNASQQYKAPVAMNSNLPSRPIILHVDSDASTSSDISTKEGSSFLESVSDRKRCITLDLGKWTYYRELNDTIMSTLWTAAVASLTSIDMNCAIASFVIVLVAVGCILWKAELEDGFETGDVKARLHIKGISFFDALTPLTPQRRMYRHSIFFIPIIAVVLVPFIGIFGNIRFTATLPGGGTVFGGDINVYFAFLIFYTLDISLLITSAFVSHQAERAVNFPEGSIVVKRGGVSYEPLLTELVSIVMGDEPYRSQFLRELRQNGYAFVIVTNDGPMRQRPLSAEDFENENPSGIAQNAFEGTPGKEQVIVRVSRVIWARGCLATVTSLLGNVSFTLLTFVNSQALWGSILLAASALFVFAHRELHSKLLNGDRTFSSYWKYATKQPSAVLQALVPRNVSGNTIQHVAIWTLISSTWIAFFTYFGLTLAGIVKTDTVRMMTYAFVQMTQIVIVSLFVFFNRFLIYGTFKFQGAGTRDRVMSRMLQAAEHYNTTSWGNRIFATMICWQRLSVMSVGEHSDQLRRELDKIGVSVHLQL